MGNFPLFSLYHITTTQRCSHLISGGSTRRRVDDRELWKKGSELHQLVRITGDLISDGVELHGLDELVRKRCERDCAYFIRSVSKDSITCGSGEYDGKPFVFGGCNICIVGQFTGSGEFIGDLQEQPDQLNQLNQFIQEN